MSPFQKDLDVELDDTVRHDDELIGRSNMPPLTRGPMQRSKRIRTPRRNGHNGMQRRRNKRVDW